MPDCPYCHCGLADDEMYDWIEMDEKVTLYYTAKCPNCGRAFKWNLVYYWDNEINDLEEDEKLE